MNNLNNQLIELQEKLTNFQAQIDNLTRDLSFATEALKKTKKERDDLKEKLDNLSLSNNDNEYRLLLERELNERVREVARVPEYRKRTLYLILKGILKWEVDGNEEQKSVIAVHKQLVIEAIDKLKEKMPQLKNEIHV